MNINPTNKYDKAAAIGAGVGVVAGAVTNIKNTKAVVQATKDAYVGTRIEAALEKCIGQDFSQKQIKTYLGKVAKKASEDFAKMPENIKAVAKNVAKVNIGKVASAAFVGLGLGVLVKSVVDKIKTSK